MSMWQQDSQDSGKVGREITSGRLLSMRNSIKLWSEGPIESYRARSAKSAAKNMPAQFGPILL